MLRHDLPQIEALVAQRVTGPVHAHLTGQASIDAALKSSMIDATRRAELIALPLLFLVLLLVLRAPIAALVVTAFGATTVFAGMGVMTLAGEVDQDRPDRASPLGSLVGLALGVGFALLMMVRFREERAARTEPHPSGVAAARAVSTAGRAVLWGGTALALCLILAVLISPTVILTSLGDRRAAVQPAGDRRRRRRDARRAGRPRPPPGASAPSPPRGPSRAAWQRLVAGGGVLTRHPAPLGALGLAALLALAVPAWGSRPGRPTSASCPRSIAARTTSSRRARHGPGLGDAVQRRRRLRAPSRSPSAALLRKVDRFQTQIASDPRVDSVVGPGALIAATSKDLKSCPRA